MRAEIRCPGWSCRRGVFERRLRRADCSMGSLSSYTSLSSGCTVGDETFSMFSYSASGNIAAASGVTATPKYFGHQSRVQFCRQLDGWL